MAQEKRLTKRQAVIAATKEETDAKKAKEKESLNVYDASNRIPQCKLTYPESRRPQHICYANIDLSGLDKLDKGDARLAKVMGGGETSNTLRDRINNGNHMSKMPGYIAVPVVVYKDTDPSKRLFKAMSYEYALGKIEGTGLLKNNGSFGEPAFIAGRSHADSKTRSEAKEAGEDSTFVSFIKKRLVNLLNKGEGALNKYAEATMNNDLYFCPAAGCTHEEGFGTFDGFRTHYDNHCRPDKQVFVCPNGEKCISHHCRSHPIETPSYQTSNFGNFEAHAKLCKFIIKY